MKKLLTVLTVLLLTTSVHAEKLDYRIENDKFITSEGVIPKGCIDANFPYPGGKPTGINYKIKKDLGEHKYLLRVCEAVDGSMGHSCGNIIVKFVNRDYSVNGEVSKVLSLEKIGEMN